MAKKYWYLLAFIILGGILIFYFSPSKKTKTANPENQPKPKLALKEFQGLEQTNPADSGATKEAQAEEKNEKRTFNQVKAVLEESIMGCRTVINENFPGEDKDVELPTDLDKLTDVFNVYQGMNDKLATFNTTMVETDFDRTEISEYLKDQNEDKQCYPYIEQELMMEALDALTDEELEAPRKKKLLKIFVHHLTASAIRPQSVFHMASYLNMMQVLGENNLVPNHITPELERMKTEIMQVVSETDERLLRSAQESDVDVYLEVQRKRQDVLQKTSEEFANNVREVLINDN
ncbi:MAG: hypothetical protein JNM93_03030 [Bacteriovoracaceae bacterium]|nr:hypothetical protein [Bacteriovoracaceae bacterium]